jgi:hypothetical protein
MLSICLGKSARIVFTIGETIIRPLKTSMYVEKDPRISREKALGKSAAKGRAHRKSLLVLTPFVPTLRAQDSSTSAGTRVTQSY